MSLKRGPWKVIGARDVYKNPWINVREDKVIRPDGKDGVFGLVTIKPGVSVLPLDKNGCIYLVEQYRYTMGKKTIEVVSGGIEDKESPLAAARRELKEEVGIKAKEWIDLGVVDPFTAVINSPNYLYLAKDLTFSNPTPEGSESIKVLKISFKKAVLLVMRGIITHSPSVSLILKVEYMNTTKILTEKC